MRIMLLSFLAIFLLCYPTSSFADLPSNYQDLPMDQQIETLLLFLSEDDSQNREFVMAELKEYGKSILPQLYSLMDKYGNLKNFEVVNAIMLVLMYYQDDASIDPIMVQLERDNDVRDTATEAVGHIYNATKSEKAYRTLIKIYKKYNRQDYLLRPIVKNADKSRIPILLELLRDKDFGRNDLIIEQLVSIADPSVAVSAIIQQLKTDDYFDRKAAVNALGEFGDKSAIPALKDAMKIEKEELIKVKIASALVKVGDFLSVAFLIDLVGSKYSDLSEWGRAELVTISGQDFGDDIAAWRKWFEEEKKRRGL